MFIVQCKLAIENRRIGLSDGSVWSAIDLDTGKCISYTMSWLPEKLAVVGNEIMLKHPDTGRDIAWKVVETWRRKEKKENPK